MPARYATAYDFGLMAAGRAAEVPVGAGAALAVAVALWATTGVWGDGLPAGGDVVGHLVRTSDGLRILTDLRLDGWSPRWGNGYQQFLFYGPGFTWLVALIRGLTFGHLSDVGALKVLMVGSYAATAPAAGFLARSLGLDRWAAGVAAVLALLASNPFGGGLDGLFGNGLVPGQVAEVLVLVAVGTTVRALAETGVAWTASSAVLVGAIAITHASSIGIYALFLVCAVPLLLVTGELSPPRLARLLTIGLGAAALTAYWWLPAWMHRDLRGPVGTWNTPPFGTRIADILAGRVLFRGVGIPLVVAGMAYGFVRVGQSKRHALVVAVVPMAMLVLAHWSLHGLPNDITASLANRELGFVGVLLTFPLAAALADLGTRLLAPASAGFTFALAIAAGLVVAPLERGPNPARQADPVAPEMVAAARELARIVPATARFATGRDYPGDLDRTRAQAPERWLAWASGRNSLNPFPLELTSAPEGAYAAGRLREAPAEESARAMARYGVTHVVSLGPTVSTRLAESSRFRPVWHAGTVQIFEVLPSPGQPAPVEQVTSDSPLTARFAARTPEHVMLDVDSPGTASVAVALAWSPNWRASVNGRAFPVQREKDGLLGLTVPSGTSRVDLRFGLDAWDYLGRIVSAVSTLAGLRLVWRRWRARRGRVGGPQPATVRPAPEPSPEPVPAGPPPNP